MLDPTPVRAEALDLRDYVYQHHSPHHGHPCQCLDKIESTLTRLLSEARLGERERSKAYLRKICWSEEDIEMFDAWSRPSDREA